MLGHKTILTTLLALALLILIYFGYNYWSKSSAPSDLEPGLTSLGVSDGEPGQNVSDEFLATLTGLRELNLRGEVFASPVFRSLKDSNIVLPEETPGRQNPFAPINFDSFLRRPLGQTAAPAANATSSTSSTSTLEGLRAR